MTTSMVHYLKKIRENNFGKALEKIEKSQAKYKRQYDKRNKATEFALKIGDKVQYRKYTGRKAKNKLSQWAPLKGYYLILNINFEHKTVSLQTIKGTILKKRQSFDRLRKFC